MSIEARGPEHDARMNMTHKKWLHNSLAKHLSGAKRALIRTLMVSG